MQKRLFSRMDKLLSGPYRKAPVLGRQNYELHKDIRLWTFGETARIEYPEAQHVQPLPTEFASLVGTVEYPRPFVLELREGKVHGRHALVSTKKGEIILESLLNHSPFLEMISAGRVHHPKTIAALWQQLSQKPHYETAFVLTNLFGNAYFHWMLECLPRLWLYKEMGEAVPILIDANPPAYVLETLALLEIQSVIEWKATAASVKRLLMPMALYGTGVPAPFAVRWLAKELLAKVMLPKVDAPLVYISRQKAKKRRVVNEAELMRFLEGQGFKIFFLEEMSLVQQMALFRQAQIVVGAHGAGFSNALFSQNVKLLEFFEPSYLNACYYRLASGMGFDYGLLLGESQALDIRVDLKLLQTLLEKL